MSAGAAARDFLDIDEIGVPRTRMPMQADRGSPVSSTNPDFIGKFLKTWGRYFSSTTSIAFRPGVINEEQGGHDPFESDEITVYGQ